jgi:hypothetical protein
LTKRVIVGRVGWLGRYRVVVSLLVIVTGVILFWVFARFD